VPDDVFEHPRLAAIYDALDPDRGDLVPYVELAESLGARAVVDLGCGTGVLALLLAARGVDVVGVDPARGLLDVARSRPGAGRVSWLVGDARSLPPLQADLVTMTGNVAQAIADPGDWAATLAGARDVLRPGGHLVFETRDPQARAWTAWNRAASYRSVELEGVGEVRTWVELTQVDLPLVSFRWTIVFGRDGAVLTSDSTLRFRGRDEVEADLTAQGFVLDDVRQAPDRPGLELVFLARRPG